MYMWYTCMHRACGIISQDILKSCSKTIRYVYGICAYMPYTYMHSASISRLRRRYMLLMFMAHGCAGGHGRWLGLDVSRVLLGG